MNSSKSRTSLAKEDTSALSLAEETKRIARLAVSSGTQFAELRSASLDWALAELAAHRDAILAMSETPRWQYLYYASTRRNIEFARSCWEVAAKTQDAMLGAMRECIGQRNSAVAASRPGQGRATTERRVGSIVINFPERRRRP